MKIEIDEADFFEIKKTLEWYRLKDEGLTSVWPQGCVIPIAKALFKYLEAKYQHGTKRPNWEKE